MQVGLSGYDLLAYRRWLRNNKVEVEGVVRLSEVYEDPSGVLGESGVKYWKDGEEIPVTAVTSDMHRPEDVAILDKDGTMHILLTTEITAIRRTLTPAVERVCRMWLRMHGYGCRVETVWEDINLQDEVEEARAALYLEQARKLRIENDAAEKR